MPAESVLVLNEHRLASKDLDACDQTARCLAAEAVQGAALALEGVHDVHSGHGLAASVLSVSHSVADHVLEEHLEDRAGLLVDEARDTLHTTTTGETTDSGLGDALDVVAENLAVTLGAALAEALATFAASGHACWLVVPALRVAPPSNSEFRKWRRPAHSSSVLERPSRDWRYRCEFLKIVFSETARIRKKFFSVHNFFFIY